MHATGAAVAVASPHLLCMLGVVVAVASPHLLCTILAIGRNSQPVICKNRIELATCVSSGWWIRLELDAVVASSELIITEVVVAGWSQ